jgi:hypothetical protein
MPDRPLRKLAPGKRDYPENLLSEEARQRIERAWSKYWLVRRQAEASIELRWEAGGGELGYMEYLSKGQAYIDFVESRMRAARIVLLAKAEEYGKLGLPVREFRDIMENEVQAVTYSLEFRDAQKLFLEEEFVVGIHHNIEDLLAATSPAQPSPSIVESNGQPKTSGQNKESTPVPNAPEATSSGAAEQNKSGRPAGLTSEAGRRRVEQHCSRLNGGRERLAELASISGKSIARLLAGEEMSRDTWIKLARAMGTRFEELTQLKSDRTEKT